ncbi:M20/M25/M40 family metallo-hydrolase [Croceicoccus naphthovorans]|uniref:M20/M25/M40 family metallo-hydrolase n=1 Tax=Croceicoccus naphthovorans TaxID=1348774 RepID=UPI000A7EA5D0|nr:M20/M25/M40 family metallo-hydrolase [Croceicoccus naphthovorans]MBB3988639.1 hypothetical protein [Croceicoccus naphthovorans]
MGARVAVTGFALGLLALTAACAPAEPLPPPASARALTPMEEALMAHVRVLSSDEFDGRAAGTPGEALTLQYMHWQLAAVGLRSGTHDPGHPWREPFSYQGKRGGAVETYNIIGRLPGTEPTAGAVLLVAHWDHLGSGAQCRPVEDDRICNGAVDNATGLAMMIEIARALADGPELRRDVYFLATGGEEDGLQGAAAFVADPPVPIEKFVAAFNLDTEGVAPAGAPAVVLGTPGPQGIGALMELISATARDEGVELVRPSRKNRRFLKRQDGWAFDAVGVPAVFISATFAQDGTMRAYMRDRYHRANDEADGVEPGATADMTAFHIALLRRAADPAWLPRSPLAEIVPTAH